MYISGGYDEDGDVIPVENLGPWDAMDESMRAIEANETAVDILVALRRTHFGQWPVEAVIRGTQRGRNFANRMSIGREAARPPLVPSCLTACRHRACARS